MIKPSSYVRPLGVTIAADLGLHSHVSNFCKTCFFWLQQLKRVHCSLDIESVKTSSTDRPIESFWSLELFMPYHISPDILRRFCHIAHRLL